MEWNGYCVDFTKKLAEYMNFDYEFVEPANGSFGKKKNGVWNGVIGDLATGVGFSILYLLTLLMS